jgi:hypothetical protein
MKEDATSDVATQVINPAASPGKPAASMSILCSFQPVVQRGSYR